MVTILKEKDNYLYCGHCRMRVSDLTQGAYCEFCGYNWANWERLMDKYYKEVWGDGVYESNGDRRD